MSSLGKVDPWSAAFCAARAVEEASCREAGDVSTKADSTEPHRRKRQKVIFEKDLSVDEQNNKEEHSSLEEKTSNHLHGDMGGFCQPPKLAAFVNNHSNDNGNYSRGAVADADSTTDAIFNTADLSREEDPNKLPPKKRTFEESCARQLCRTWLKYTYLKIGKDCDGAPSCLRLHFIPDTLLRRPESLYKDFSFKGLNPNQRKAILRQLKGAEPEQQPET